MQLSQTAEYALRAVVYLAEHPAEPQTNQQIADGCRMPAGYLAKVLQPLNKAGIVTAQRGLGGGYVLARSTDDLTLLDVVGAVEPIQRIRSCPLKIASHGYAPFPPDDKVGSRLCALHQTLDDALALVEKTLEGQTVGAILRKKAAVKPLCENKPATVPLGFGGLGNKTEAIGGGARAVGAGHSPAGFPHTIEQRDGIGSAGTDAT